MSATSAVDLAYVGETWQSVVVDTPALDAAHHVERASRLGRTQVTQAQVAPASAIPAEAVLPVLPGLADLLPGGVLRRGSVLTVQGSGSLLLSLLAEASAQGSWCAEVGSPLVGSAAAAEMGVALDRFVRVPAPGERWPEVVASLLDGFDVVVVHPPARRTAQDDRAVRRLSARTRERGAVLVATGPWEGAGLGLAVTEQRWHGLGRGHGHLAAREVVVSAVGRGAAVRPRRARLWLPAADGHIGPVAAPPAPELSERTGVRAVAGSDNSNEGWPAGVAEPARWAG